MTEAEKRVREAYSRVTPEEIEATARYNNRLEAKNQQRALAAEARRRRETEEAQQEMKQQQN